MDLNEIENKRVAVLLSGGVDSSVVVYEFAKLGLHPDCFYIKIGPEEEEEWDCSSEEDLEMATAVAHKYGCRLEVIDCHQEYWDQVTAYTMEKVRAGYTPNPDVMCNRLIKFGAFDQKRGHDYDLIATGHYAQTETETISEIVNGKSVNRKLKWLCTSPDPVKDQTDFLAQIYDWQLRKALFPIGHYMKDEVRVIAEREHLLNWRLVSVLVSIVVCGSIPLVSARVWGSLVGLGLWSRRMLTVIFFMCRMGMTRRQPIRRTSLCMISIF